MQLEPLRLCHQQRATCLTMLAPLHRSDSTDAAGAVCFCFLREGSNGSARACLSWDTDWYCLPSLGSMTLKSPREPSALIWKRICQPAEKGRNELPY